MSLAVGIMLAIFSSSFPHVSWKTASRAINAHNLLFVVVNKLVFGFTIRFGAQLPSVQGFPHVVSVVFGLSTLLCQSYCQQNKHLR